ncbi:MAG TPA: M43 family zinc metalloprotease [Bacteroidales bacterium]|nr:M43 family zinc metalloprotease [Bacteroidales bacterium]HRZ48924.1 M43 family zinc metalloprotease [Bacteroidales bacterium]
MNRFTRNLALMILLPAMMLCGITRISAQHDEEDATHRKCGYHEYLHMLDEEDPGFPARREMIEMQMQQWLKDNPQVPGQSKVVYTIPVVVHILYYTSAQNIPYSRVTDQIDALNKDFRKLNTDVGNTPNAFKSKVADVEFQFCLAQRDPQGNWTNGVTRTQVTKSSYTINDDNLIKLTAQGGQNAWDANKYLNIWIVNLTGGVLGYTQPPGGPASKDGVVICYKYFGTNGATAPFNKGRTATHEIGHWFNLVHIWGDDNGACWGSDLVGDTPNQAVEFYGIPAFPQKDACTPDSPGVMFMNYMDYVDDAAMVMFTNGQKTRMISALNAYRSGLKTSDGCLPGVGIGEIPEVFDFTVYPNPAAGIFYLELMLNRSSDIGIVVTDPAGRQVYTRSQRVVSDLTEPLDLTHLSEGVYLLHLITKEQTLTKRIVIRKGY